MAKITSDDCKNAIVEAIKANPDLVTSQFEVTDGDEWVTEALPSAMKTSNWKRFDKSKVDDSLLETMGFPKGIKVTERSFDCVTFDDQLRAYVYESDGQIIRVLIQGE